MVTITDRRFHTLASQKNPAFYRADGNVQVIGNLLVFVATVEHQERYTVQITDALKDSF